MAINAGTIFASLKLNSDGFFTALDRAAKGSEELQGKLDKISDTTGKMGSALTKGLTLPIMGVGTAAILTGANFEKGMSEVAAISGASGKELEDLTKKAREMGSTTKFSATESAEAMQYMAMAGWDTNQMMVGLDGVMNLAAASGEGLGLVADIVTDALTAFGMEAEDSAQFADLLASASSNANTNVALMGESFKYVAPVFGALGYTAEDAALAIGLMGNAGIKGGQAGTSLRTSINSLVKPTKETAEVMDTLGLSITDSEGQMKPFIEIMDDLRESFGELDEAQQAQYASTLFGQQGMSGMLAIINAAPEDYRKLTEATREYDGTAKKMAETMEDNLKGQLTVLKSQLEDLGIEIFQQLVPHLSSLVEKMQAAAEWFANLDEKTQGNIIKFALFAAGIGPLLSGFSKITGAASGLVGIFGKLAGGAAASSTAATAAGTAAAGTGAAFTGAAAAALPWIAAIGGVAIAGYGVYKHLSEELIPEVDLFGDQVSETTAQVVGDFLEMENEVTLSLNQLSWSGGEVTEEMAETITTNITGMTEQIVEAYEEQKNEALQSLEELFANSKDMTEEEKEHLLKITEEKYDQQILKAEDGERQINAIIDKAAKENRELKSWEKEAINEIQERMKNDGIQILSENQAEAEAILLAMKNQAEEMSARQAAEVIRNSIDQKEKTIAEAEEEYMDRMKYAAQLKADGTKESAELADKIIEEATRQKDDTVAQAEQMHQNVVNEVAAMGGDLISQINLDNGSIKTNWSSLKDWFTNNPITRWIKTISDNASTYANQGQGLGRNARGTESWRGGLTWVGEQGRELVDLPKGSKVYSNQKSETMLAGAGAGADINLTIDVPVVLDGREIAKGTVEFTADELQSLIDRQRRGL